MTIVYGSFSAAWGVDFSPTLRHWEMAVTRGVEAILDTTFLSALATPFAAILGMVIAWLVVRKKFSGKEALDFASNWAAPFPVQFWVSVCDGLQPTSAGAGDGHLCPAGDVLRHCNWQECT
jgi:ABC-type spermidine/putrescine transport system permease subunit II